MRNKTVTFRKFIIVLYCLGLFALAGCSSSIPSGTPTSGTADMPARDWYSVYFTQPGDPAMRGYRGGPDQHLAEAIEAARLSVDIAVLDLDLWSLRDALIAADRRGVAVRLVVESDYLDGKEIQEIREAGIPVLGDRREGLMHNKFAVIDRAEVWTGSMNYTVSEAYRNNNNLIRLRSPHLAEDYTVEFEEMFADDLFGPGSPANTPHPVFSVEGVEVEVYFSPDDGVTRQLVELVSSAEESVYFLAYSFTSDDLAGALLERHQAGVEIAGVMEARQVESNTGSDYERFRAEGIDVRLDGNPDNMHHKLLIIDGQTVVTGSFNFSRSAEERNDENALVLHDPRLAVLYLGEFDKVFSEAQSR